MRVCGGLDRKGKLKRGTEKDVTNLIALSKAFILTVNAEGVLSKSLSLVLVFLILSFQ